MSHCHAGVACVLTCAAVTAVLAAPMSGCQFVSAGDMPLSPGELQRLLAHVTKVSTASCLRAAACWPHRVPLLSPNYCLHPPQPQDPSTFRGVLALLGQLYLPAGGNFFAALDAFVATEQPALIVADVATIGAHDLGRRYGIPVVVNNPTLLSLKQVGRGGGVKPFCHGVHSECRGMALRCWRRATLCTCRHGAQALPRT